jgi:DNA-directed RNA polymerase subunit K/omega
MNAELEAKYTKFEIARIIGARALQIAMDAPLLMKLSENELKAMNYDAIKLAEREFDEGVLPIAISRPMPKKKKTALVIAEEKVSDEELEQKAKEVEKEIKENPEEFALTQADKEEVEETVPEAGAEEA